MGKYKQPDLSNATPRLLVDELATIRAKMNLLKFLEKIYKTALLARTTSEDWAKGFLEGDKFIAERSMIPRHAIDQTRVKEILELPRVQEALEELGFKVSDFFSDTEVDTIRMNPLPTFNVSETWGVTDEDIFKAWGQDSSGKEESGTTGDESSS